MTVEDLIAAVRADWPMVADPGPRPDREEAILAAVAQVEAERSAALGSAWWMGARLCPPVAVRTVAAVALTEPGGGADRALARRIVAGALTPDDLGMMRGAALAGGETGALWAENEARILSRAALFAFQRSAVPTDTPEARAGLWRAWVGTVHGPTERRAALAVQGWLRGWARAIAARVPEHLPDARALHRRDLASWLLDLIGLSEATAALRSGPTATIIQRAVELAFRRAGTDLGMGSTVFEPTADLYAMAIGQLITRVGQTTVDAVAATVTEALLLGESTTALQARILEMPEFGVARARTVARTETGKALSIGQRAAEQTAQALGVEAERTWLSARDSAVRPTHSAADGQRRALGEPFLVGDVSTDGPCLCNVAAEDINCRCTVIVQRVKKGDRNADRPEPDRSASLRIARASRARGLGGARRGPA